MAGLPRLDRIDLNILVHLSQDGSLTNLQLSERVGLSPSPCLQRVKRLEQAGYIAGYNARIDLARLMDAVTVFTEVTLVDHRLDDFVKFESSIRDVQEITECHLISGGYDYLLRFMTRSIAHYQACTEGLLARNIGIAKYFSYIVIKTPIAKPGPPLAVLLRDQLASGAAGPTRKALAGRSRGGE
jgi:DNA-binding Lrp family transcriptional regulator